MGIIAWETLAAPAVGRAGHTGERAGLAAGPAYPEKRTTRHLRQNNPG